MHQECSEVSKISVDYKSQEFGEDVSDREVIAAVQGCLVAVRSLGRLEEMIEAIRIEFRSFPNGPALRHLPGPVFRFHCRSVIGKFEIETNWQCIPHVFAKRPHQPTVEQIAEHLSKWSSEQFARELKHRQAQLDELLRVTKSLEAVE